MKKRIYNVIFPIWFLIFIPMTWLVVLPANFIIDSLVILLATYLFIKSNYWLTYKQTIFKVWGFGFLSDFIGALILFSTYLIDSEWWYQNILYPVSYHPFESIFGFIWCTIATFISAICIYQFNYRFSFKKLEIDLKTKKKMALTLAILTAPYLFLLPTALFY